MNNVIRIARNFYFEKHIKIIGKDSKKVWNSIKKSANINKGNKSIISNIVNNKGTKITDSENIVQEFDNFSSNIGRCRIYKKEVLETVTLNQ